MKHSVTPTSIPREPEPGSDWIPLGALINNFESPSGEPWEVVVDNLREGTLVKSLRNELRKRGQFETPIVVREEGEGYTSEHFNVGAPYPLAQVDDGVHRVVAHILEGSTMVHITGYAERSDDRKVVALNLKGVHLDAGLLGSERLHQILSWRSIAKPWPWLQLSAARCNGEGTSFVLLVENLENINIALIEEELSARLALHEVVTAAPADEMDGSETSALIDEIVDELVHDAAAARLAD